MSAPLTTINCVKLAELIQSCRSGGTRKLRLLLPDGTMLEKWAEGAVFVNDTQFYYLAREKGL